ncbi:MAG: hypothetical protein D6788_07980, partial [Planctomycetota bacterium]
AVTLPWLEILCGIGLVLGIWTRAAAIVVALMLAGFTPAIFLRAMEIHRNEGTPFFKIAFDCGCGTGVIVTWKKLLENTALFLAAVLTACSRTTVFSVSAYLARTMGKPPSSEKKSADEAVAAPPPASPGAKEGKPAPEVSTPS